MYLSKSALRKYYLHTVLKHCSAVSENEQFLHIFLCYRKAVNVKYQLGEVLDFIGSRLRVMETQ